MLRYFEATLAHFTKIFSQPEPKLTEAQDVIPKTMCTLDLCFRCSSTLNQTRKINIVVLCKGFFHPEGSSMQFAYGLSQN